VGQGAHRKPRFLTPILKLYANSGPVPVTIIKKLKTFIDAQAKKAA